MHHHNDGHCPISECVCTELTTAKCIECERERQVNDRRMCRECWDNGIKSIDWLMAVRRYGIETANTMFPPEEGE